MDMVQALDSSAADFIALVARVDPTQWQDTTPCEQWDVRALVGHVITTTYAYAELLHGASAARTVELRTRQQTLAADDALTAVTDAAARAQAAFAEPGALERTVHHPMGDLPGSQLLWMRVVDNVVHGWDLATALHVPAVIDGVLAEDLYQRLAPLADVLMAAGYIAAPRRPLTSDAVPQERLLTLLGR